MQHKGNKSEETIKCEQLFVSIVSTLEMGFLYEQYCGTGTIDFVVGDKAKGNAIYYCGMTGVELKTSMNDMRTWNGLNVKAYPYNYLLVPEKIAYSAFRRMEQYSDEFDHVGLLVLEEEDYTLNLFKQAKFIVPSDRNTELMKRIRSNVDEYADYYDSVAYMLGVHGDNPVSVHNFKTNETRIVRLQCIISEEDINLEGKGRESA